MRVESSERQHARHPHGAAELIGLDLLAGPAPLRAPAPYAPPRPGTPPVGHTGAPALSIVPPVGRPAQQPDPSRRAHETAARGRTETPTPRLFRDVVGRFATGVTVITASDGAELRGMTANAFTAVSLDPLLVLVCLRLGCATDEMLTRTEHFGINILSARQQSVAAWFANPNRPAGRAQLDVVGWSPSAVTGSPVIDGAVGWLDCAVDHRVVVGDHAVIYARVIDLAGGECDGPLLFHRGEFGTIGSLPGFRAAG